MQENAVPAQDVESDYTVPKVYYQRPRFIEILDKELAGHELTQAELAYLMTFSGFRLISGSELLGWCKIVSATTDKNDTRKRLIRLRKKLQFSRSQLAVLLRVPVNTLRRWEIGTRRPSDAAQQLVRLVERILDGSPPKTLMDLAFGDNSDDEPANGSVG